jgi:hypothetical protein
MNKLKLINFGKCLLPFISECFVFFSTLSIVKLKLYKTIILLAVLYGCEIWSLTLRDIHGLRVFGKRVARRIFGSKSDEVTEYLRKFRNEKLHDCYSIPNNIRINR